jgi:hypothetical protein
MFGFFKGFLVCLFLVYWWGSQNYADRFNKKIYIPAVLFISRSPIRFIRVMYNYLFPEKIILTGFLKNTVILEPKKFYDITCSGNTTLNLHVTDSVSISGMRLSDNACVNLIKADGVKNPTVTIRKVFLYDTSVLQFDNNIILEAEFKINDKACTVESFKSWKHLQQSDLSKYKLSKWDERYLKNI